MDAITAVLKDLYTFAVVYHFGLKAVESKEESSAVDAFVEKLSSGAPQELVAPQSYALLPPLPSSVPASPPSMRSEGVGYAFAPETLLYALPTRTFDGVIKRLSYGESFQLLGTQGKWSNVLVDDIRGWIHNDAVTQSSAELHPQFVQGELYDAEHPMTIRLRTCIDDAFHAAVLAIPLQDVEYVTYRLTQKGKQLEWPTLRPRIAGTWQRLLKGVRGVHIGVHPRTGSVMEYMLDEGIGHVAYVESVYPDGGITIQEVGYPRESQFGERTLSKEEWKELRPVFIDCT